MPIVRLEDQGAVVTFLLETASIAMAVVAIGCMFVAMVGFLDGFLGEGDMRGAVAGFVLAVVGGMLFVGAGAVWPG